MRSGWMGGLRSSWGDGEVEWESEQSQVVDACMHCQLEYGRDSTRCYRKKTMSCDVPLGS